MAVDNPWGAPAHGWLTGWTHCHCCHHSPCSRPWKSGSLFWELGGCGRASETNIDAAAFEGCSLSPEPNCESSLCNSWVHCIWCTLASCILFFARPLLPRLYSSCPWLAVKTWFCVLYTNIFPVTMWVLLVFTLVIIFIYLHHNLLSQIRRCIQCLWICCCGGSAVMDLPCG